MKKVLLCFCLLSIIYHAISQVPVSKEPRHHVVFENKKARLLNVLLPPNDTTQYHLHSTPSVFICFTSTNTSSQLVHQQPVGGISKAGSIWFENLDAPYEKIHRVWNNDTSTYHVMDIEILTKDSGFEAKPLVLPHLTTVIDTPWARTYKIELGKSEKVSIKEHASPFVLISMDSGMITKMKKGKKNHLSLKPGTFSWIKPGEELTLLNQKDNVIQFALVELK